MRKYILHLFFLLPIFSVKAANLKEDTIVLQQKLQTNIQDSSKINILLKLALINRHTNPRKSLQFANRALAIAKETNDSKSLINIYIEKKKCFFWLNEWNKAIQQAQYAVDVAAKLNNPHDIVESKYHLADINLTSSNYVEALKNYLSALEVAERNKISERMIDIYGGIGLIYFRQKNFDKSLEYYEKLLAVAIEMKDSIAIAGAYDSQGSVLDNQKQFGKATEFHQKALHIAMLNKDTTTMISAGNNLGINLKKMSNYPQALKCYLSTYDLLLKSNPSDSLWLSYIKLNIGSVYTKLGQYDKSEEYLKEGIKYLLRSNDIEGITDAYFNFFELYQAQANDKLALNYYLKYSNKKDSTYTLEKSKQLMQLQERFNLDKKDFEIKSLSQLNKLNQSEIKKQKLLKNSFIGGFILILTLSLVLYNRFNIKAKSTAEIKQANINLKATQQQLIQQEKLASLGALTAGIAHEIKNPLNFVTNFSDLSGELITEYEESADEEEKADILKDLKSNLEKIAHHGKRANSIVASMLQHARGGEGERQLTDINQICNEFMDLSYQGLRAKIPDFNCTIEKKLDTTISKINVIPQDISRVILNLLNNAFYAVNEKSTLLKKLDQPGDYKPNVTVSTSASAESLIIKIIDNGSGIPDNVKQKIFEPFFTTKASGEGTGLGLSICNDIIKAHGGKMSAVSEINVFTEFIITLPI